MEMTAGHIVAIVVAVVILAVAAVAMTITALFNSLNAGLGRLESRISAHEQVMGEQLKTHEQVMGQQMEAHEQVMGQQMEAIKAAVAEGTEEHKTWQAALDKTNDRLDQLLLHLLERKS